MKKKKVVFVMPYLYSGGAERAIILLMNNINREIYEPEIIVLKDGGTLKSLIRSDVVYHGFGDMSVKNSYFKLLIKLKELKPDIVMTTMVHSNFLLMLLKPFFPKTKFIIREAIVPSYILDKHKSKAWLIKLLYKSLYPFAYRVISPSQNIIDEFSKTIGLDIKNHVVLHNQVDEDLINKSIANIAFPKATDKMLRFVCAGRLNYQKGYDRLISALENFNPPYDWKLLILGDGEEHDNLINQVKNANLDHKIAFMGNVKNPWSIIAAADCLLLPSRYEGMPNVLLESLTCGTRVIASKDANGVFEIRSDARDESVQIAKDMQEFIAMMEAILPQNKVLADASLLGDQFKKERIIKKFEDILH